MAEGIKTPPKFDGFNFPLWKVKMIVFLQSLESRVAKAVTKPFSVPIGDEDTWSDMLLRSLMQMLRHTMSYFKLWMMMIF